MLDLPRAMTLGQDVIDMLDMSVLDQDKVVSFKWIQQHMSLHANHAQRVLEQYAESKRDAVAITWIVTGKVGAAIKITLATHNTLEECLSTFSTVYSKRAYTVQKVPSKDPRVVLAANPLHGARSTTATAEESELITSFSEIKFGDYEKRKAPVRATPPSTAPAPARPPLAKAASSPQAVPVKAASQRTLSKSNSAGKGNMNSFFTPRANVPPPPIAVTPPPLAATSPLQTSPARGPSPPNAVAPVPHLPDIFAASGDSPPPSPTQTRKRKLQKFSEKKADGSNEVEIDISEKVNKKAEADAEAAGKKAKKPRKPKATKEEKARAKEVSYTPPPDTSASSFFGTASASASASGGKSRKQVTRTFEDEDGFEVTETVWVTDEEDGGEKGKEGGKAAVPGKKAAKKPAPAERKNNKEPKKRKRKDDDGDEPAKKEKKEKKEAVKEVKEEKVAIKKGTKKAPGLPQKSIMSFFGKS